MHVEFQLDANRRTLDLLGRKNPLCFLLAWACLLRWFHLVRRLMLFGYDQSYSLATLRREWHQAASTRPLIS